MQLLPTSMLDALDLSFLNFLHHLDATGLHPGHPPDIERWIHGPRCHSPLDYLHETDLCVSVTMHLLCLKAVLSSKKKKNVFMMQRHTRLNFGFSNMQVVNYFQAGKRNAKCSFKVGHLSVQVLCEGVSFRWRWASW